MNSFIVMQGETYHEERNAGILWTPQIDKSGMVPHSWARMRELKKGDHVFHYVKGSIVALSMVKKDCRLDSKADKAEKVFVAEATYRELESPLPVREHFAAIKPLLPVKYSPFQEDASGNSGYLYPCNEELALQLVALIRSVNVFKVQEEQLELAIEVVRRTSHNPLVAWLAEMELELDLKIKQGKEQFRANLLPLWQNECPLCGVAIEELLVAAYAKPWKDSSDLERLEPHNGILLCANHAALFKAGLITFTGGGRLRIAGKIAEKDYSIYGLAESLKVQAVPEHAAYFRWHKRNIFIEPRNVRLAKPAENKHPNDLYLSMEDW